MQISFVRDVEDFSSLSDAWNRLLERAATNVPFLRHEYLKAWWFTLGGGEWESGELWIGVGQDDHGALQGIAPLFLSRTPEGEQVLMLMGTVEISDYLDIIAPMEKTHIFVEALFAELGEKGVVGWDVLDLYNIPEASPSLQALEAAAQKRGWSITRELLQPCPVVTLDGTWEDYLARLEKKQRHELRRKIRRAEARPGGVRWQIIGPDDDLEKAIETFMSLMAFHPAKDDFLTAEMSIHFPLMMRMAHANGWLHLSFLEVDGEAAVGYLNFDYLNRLWVYNSGMDPAYISLSPGWVLLGYLIQWAIENGRGEIDFMRGDEKYKYQLGGVDRRIVRLKISR
jgi:CelD/BcsL family acetyltransferase involved in cellulose biosynthesis